MNVMEQLQFLSLVSKVCTELGNHMGSEMADKVLAEFIINIAEKNNTPKGFHKALIENGAEFPETFSSNLLRMMQRMMPKKFGEIEIEKEIETEKTDQGDENEGELFDITFDKKKNNNKKESSPKREERYSPSNPTEENRRRRSRSPEVSRRRSPQRNDRNRRSRSSENRRRRSRSPEISRRRSPQRNDRNRRSRSSENRRRRSRSPEVSRRRSPQRNDRDRRSRSSENRRRSPKFNKIDEKPVIYKIYDGRVVNIKEFGAFVKIEGVKGRPDGLVHISAIRDAPVHAVTDVLKRDQRVKVKVKTVAGNRIELSMREVDQESGRDLMPRSIQEMDEEEEERLHLFNPSGPSKQQQQEQQSFKKKTKTKRKKQMTETELWELKQLVSSGVLPRSALDEVDQDDEEDDEDEDEIEEDVEIEINPEEPRFLRGQTRKTIALSPIKVVKNPEGTLNRAATTQSALSKERRELRQQQTRAKQQTEDPHEMNLKWQDPTAKKDEKKLYSQLENNSEFQMEEWKKQTFAKSSGLGKLNNKTIREQRESLPIFKLRDELLNAISENQILVVIGHTGSGKTTQMTQYLAEVGMASGGVIGCTQPRRVAAMSVSKRVAEEYGCRLGEEVGYSIRFEDCTSPQTKIKYMTDGMLLRECLVDSDLTKYSVIILDEAHERTIHTDVLFGLLKKTILKRKDLKLIVTSATLDAEKFSTYFFNCKIFSVPGLTFPVEKLYAKAPESDYLDATLITVMQIHLSEPPGDILVFLTGQEEIDTAVQILYERMKALGSTVPELIILPIYAALPSEMQARIFDPAPPGKRKCVISTNIAETSVTIDGIYYVVDPGFVKQKVYNPKMGMDSLMVVPISQAASDQRSGRAGRTGPGKCYRLYTENAYRNEMHPNSIPEIQRTNLANTVLTLKALGINDLMGFDFMDPPPVQTLLSALEQLYALGALDDEGLLTKIGRKMAEFPLEPQLSKMLLTSADLGCSDEIITIVSMLSVEEIFYRPKEKQSQSDQKKAQFHQPEGDHLTLLSVYQSWARNRFSNPWCYENYIQARSMKRAQDIRKQLLGIMDRYKLKVMSCGKNFDLVRKSILSGFFQHAARRDPTEGYKTLVEGQVVHIHPSSSLFQKNPDWVIYHELVLTTKEYMRSVLTIDPKWLVDFAPKYYKFAESNKISKRKKREKIEPLEDKYRDKNAWRLSKRTKKK